MSYNARLGIALSCERLPKLYPNINAVSCAYVYVRQSNDLDFELVGRTEVVIDDNRPQYETVLTVDYFFRRKQHIRIDIWDVADRDGSIGPGSGAKKLGSVETTLSRIVRLKRLNSLLLDDEGGLVGKGASLDIRVVSLRREKRVVEAPREPTPPIRFTWRRVKRWALNPDDGFYEWQDIPAHEQTSGVVEISLESNARVSDLMNAVLEAAGLPPDPKEDTGDNPDAEDSDLDDDRTLQRRERKREEMTTKELALTKVWNRNILNATLTVTSNSTTKTLRVISLHETEYDPTLEYLRDHYLFAAGSDGRSLVTLQSHGFVVFGTPPSLIHARQSAFLNALRDSQYNYEASIAEGAGPDWKLLSASCRHCQAKIQQM